MAADDDQERQGFNDLLAELTDSDVVVEVAAATGMRRATDVAPLQRIAEAVEASYQALAGAIPVKLETVASLDEVVKQSRSLWLRAKVDGDGALHDSGDASLLKFLARGTLAIIAWMDGSSTLQLADLQQAIRVLAWGTSITTTSQPELPSSADLVRAITAWQQAKQGFGAGDRVRIITSNGATDLDATRTIAEPRALLQARKLNHSAEMIFVVEMPDYQSSGQWVLKHGGTRTTAIAESGTLLDRFYRRELDIRPGDALRCRVDIETAYAPDHEVLVERYRISEILEVLPASKPDNNALGPHADQVPARQDVAQYEEAAS